MQPLKIDKKCRGWNPPPPNEKCHIPVIIKTTYFIFLNNKNTFVSQVLSHEIIVYVDIYGFGGVFTGTRYIRICAENQHIHGRENDENMLTSSNDSGKSIILSPSLFCMVLDTGPSYL